MKKIQSVIFFSIFALFCQAAPVSVEQARHLAAQEIVRVKDSKSQDSKNQASRLRKSNIQASDVFASLTLRDIEAEHLYLFAGETEGVLLSADDKGYPVLAYFDSELPATAELPANIRHWLQEYDRQIAWAIEHQAEPAEGVKQAWQAVAASQKAEQTIVVAPLIATQWDQDAPYNLLSPKQCPTGCVATAMAQIMRYWSFPARGTGQKSYSGTGGTLTADFEATEYDWAHMPLTLSAGSSQQEKEAVATLMYHCGVATEMSYSSTGSGTFVIENFSRNGYDCAEYALKNYFGYKPTMHGELRDYKDDYTPYSDEEWTEMVKEDLLQGRPVLYAGYGDNGGGGHAFVCDGYRDDDYFHFNWGWSGYYDGYFRLNALTLSGVGTGGGDGNFNTYQNAIFGLEPDLIETLTPDRFDLQMGSVMSLSKERMAFVETSGKQVSVSALVKNFGEIDYGGALMALLTDDKGNTLDTIRNGFQTIRSAQRTIVSFSYTPEQMLMPGVYTFTLCYLSVGDGSLVPIGDDYYSSATSFEVYYENENIDVVAAIDWGEEEVIYTEEWATLSTQIQNISRSSFTGKARFVLVSTDMTAIVQTLQETDFSAGVLSGDTVTLTSVDSITAPEGDYLLAVQFYRSSWSLAGSLGHFNPIRVTIRQRPAETAVEQIHAGVSVYPNPTADVLHVVAEKGATARLIGLSGQCVLTAPLTTGTNQLSVSALPTGMYLLRLDGEDQHSVTRILIQH